MLDDEAFVHRKTDACRALAASTGHLDLLQNFLALHILDSLIHDLLTEALVGRISNPPRQVLAVLIQGLEDLPDGVEHRLAVWQWQAGPWQTLALVQFLFCRENILHEVLLQPLVGQVDAELLKRVSLEVLETIDVEDADVLPNLLAIGFAASACHCALRRTQLPERVVDLVDNTLEEPIVHGLDEALQCMPELGCASGHLVEGAPARHCDLFLCQTCSKFICIKTKHFGCLVQTDLVQLNGWSLVVSLLRAALHEVLVQVAQMDEASKHPPHAADDGFVQADSV
mmetsp:Transcript_16530/g.57889  ORF Transcript_16530/g.57889 Transcript_16530/m.57889 type:complete len:285 (-) Transcript_16530:1021-1875(-)